MKDELRDQWVAALRSGQFTQGRTALCLPDKNGYLKPVYCCLGVLLQIIDPSKDMIAVTQEHNDYAELFDPLGLSYDDRYHLITMNDPRRNSFTQIADWIEANL